MERNPLVTSNGLTLPEALNEYDELIGKAYWPLDNSGSFCLEDDTQRYYLAGHSQPTGGKEREMVEIISEPFQRKYNLVFDTTDLGHKVIIMEHAYILVKCRRGLRHCVMFYDRALRKPMPEQFRLPAIEL